MMGVLRVRAAGGIPLAAALISGMTLEATGAVHVGGDPGFELLELELQLVHRPHLPSPAARPARRFRIPPAAARHIERRGSPAPFTTMPRTRRAGTCATPASARRERVACRRRFAHTRSSRA